MAYSDVVWNYKDPLTTQKLNQMDDNSVFCAEHRIFGCTPDITGTSTVKISPGRMEIDGKWLVRSDFCTALTADNNACWEEGANAEGSSTGWYIVAWNDSGESFNVKFRASGPAYSDTLSGTASGPKVYDKTGTTWYRYIVYLYNNENQALQKIKMSDDGWFQYICTAIETSCQVNSSWATYTILGLVSPMIDRANVNFRITSRGAKYAQLRAYGAVSGAFSLGGITGAADRLEVFGIFPFDNGRLQMWGSGNNSTAIVLTPISYRLAGRN